MDTPERSQIGTPLSKFEDSPVFNYINSLSPIKPVKSVNISQTFNSLSFAAIPSIFTSPHVKEFRFLRRHQSSDQFKDGNSAENGNKLVSCEDVADALQLSDNSAVPLESSLEGAPFESHNENPKFAVQLSQSLKFDCGSPDGDPTPCSSGGRDGAPDLAGPSASLFPSVQEASERALLESKAPIHEICQTAQKREELGCDWESLTSDAADLLTFSSTDGTETFRDSIQKPIDPVTSFCTSLVSEFPQDDFTGLHKQYTVPVSSSEQQEAKDPSSERNEIDQARDILADTYRIKKINDEAGKCMSFTSKPIFNLHHGIRRRCLVFEMTGAHRKNLSSASDSCSSSLSQSGGKITANDEQLVPFKLGRNTPRCILPGIGLHLNSLATTSKDHKNVKHEIVPTDGQLMNGPSSPAAFHSPSINQEPTTNSSDLTCSERGTDPNESGLDAAEDILQASVHATIEDLNQSSPKKKRCKLELAGEPEACKRCNCKKSKCLKLYCECFAAGVYCMEPCSCQECFNKPIHEDTVLATRKQIESRNPLAFAPKVIRNSNYIAEIGDELNKTPASARHKRGCNCKKSSCLKKYCECYQGGVGCSISCRCEGCKNAFGRKDGSAPLGTGTELEEETETGKMIGVDQHLQNTVIQNDEEHNLQSAPPSTPLQIVRPSAQLPVSSKRRLPRSSFLATESSSVLHVRKRLGKRNFPPPQPKFQKHLQTVAEDEMPDILRGSCSPGSGIKTASPNSKRVSPPHCGSSPSHRGSRKLILQSIPSFPSLTQN